MFGSDFQRYFPPLQSIPPGSNVNNVIRVFASCLCRACAVAVDMNLERLSDTRRWAFPPKDGPLKKVVKVATKPVVTLFGWGEGAVRAVLRLPKERETDEWWVQQSVAQFMPSDPCVTSIRAIRKQISNRVLGIHQSSGDFGRIILLCRLGAEWATMSRARSSCISEFPVWWCSSLLSLFLFSISCMTHIQVLKCQYMHLFLKNSACPFSCGLFCSHPKGCTSHIAWPAPRRMYSRGRQNTVAFVRLRCRTTNSVFCVATYHMPCAFWYEILPLDLLRTLICSRVETSWLVVPQIVGPQLLCSQMYLRTCGYLCLRTRVPQLAG